MTTTTAPWLEATVVETAREAIYAYSKRGVPGGVYEPFLNHPVWKEAGISLLVCAGRVGAHHDSEELPRHAHFAVIINDGWIAKMKEHQCYELPLQIPGSFFYLDVHEEHELKRDPRVPVEQMEDFYVPGFAVLVMNLDEHLTEEETDARFRQAFAKVADQFRYGMPDFYRTL